jgi:hypothetical protein
MHISEGSQSRVSKSEGVPRGAQEGGHEHTKELVHVPKLRLRRRNPPGSLTDARYERDTAVYERWVDADGQRGRTSQTLADANTQPCTCSSRARYALRSRGEGVAASIERRQWRINASPLGLAVAVPVSFASPIAHVTYCPCVLSLARMTDRRIASSTLERPVGVDARRWRETCLSPAACCISREAR